MYTYNIYMKNNIKYFIIHQKQIRNDLADRRNTGI